MKVEGLPGLPLHFHKQKARVSKAKLVEMDRGEMAAYQDAGLQMD